MKALILDIEINSRNEMFQLCSDNCANISSIDMASNVSDAIDLHLRNTYDIIFMGLEMTEEQGLKLLRSIQIEDASIIVFSSEQNSMIEAHKFHISDFLLKPIQTKELIATVNKVEKAKVSSEKVSNDYSHFKEMVDGGEFNRIALTTLDGYIIVHFDDIIRCEASGNYTSVYFHDGSFLMLTRTLKHYDIMLSENGFFRIHKTHLVNLKYIRNYVKGKNSYVELTDGSMIEVASRKKERLVEKLNT